jgi:hypothetical protein
MDTNKPPYRLLYSVVLFQVMTPISTTTQLSPCLQDRGIYRLCTYPGTLRFSITPHRTSCFYKEAPCRMGLEPISPPRSASYPLDERHMYNCAHSYSDASMKKQLSLFLPD